METKRCPTCNKEQTLINFFKDLSRKDGLKPQCKVCHMAGSKKGDASRARKYRLGRGKETSKLYRKANKGKVLARINKRRAMKIQATPSWFEKEKIEKLYEKCNMKTTKTGIRHVVDHIVPLLHKRVCGLHCLDNLRITTYEFNHRKNNDFNV